MILPAPAQAGSSLFAGQVGWDLLTGRYEQELHHYLLYYSLLTLSRGPLFFIPFLERFR